MIETMAYRNYRELTEDEIAELERLYPVTPNRELSRRFGISVDALQDYVAKPRGWKKDRKAVLIGNRGGHQLTEKETGWIVRHYRRTKNADIMEKYGIGESALYRVARKYGLKKSRQQMKKTQANATAAAHQACKDYGIYEETRERQTRAAAERRARGERIPGSFMPGESNRTRFGRKRFAQIIAKATATRNESIRKDRMRIRWGLPQKTKLKLVGGGHQRACHRYLFRKHGYIVPRGSNEVYYDNDTTRSVQMEQNARLWGLHVLSADEVEWED